MKTNSPAIRIKIDITPPKTTSKAKRRSSNFEIDEPRVEHPSQTVPTLKINKVAPPKPVQTPTPTKKALTPKSVKRTRIMKVRKHVPPTLEKLFQSAPKTSKVQDKLPKSKGQEGDYSLEDFYIRNSSLSAVAVRELSYSQDLSFSKRSSIGSVMSTEVKGTSQHAKFMSWKQENIRPIEIMSGSSHKSMVRFSNTHVQIVSHDILQSVFPSEYEKIKQTQRRSSLVVPSSLAEPPSYVEEKITSDTEDTPRPVLCLRLTPLLSTTEDQTPSPLFSSDNSNCSLMTDDSELAVGEPPALDETIVQESDPAKRQ
jgi:hypothetical protein